MMKKSAMVPLEHGEETLYFCNEVQKTAFQKNPKQYLKKIPMGHHHIAMNTLTIKEYVDTMGSMAEKGGPNDTHWVSAYLDVDGNTIELPSITVKLIAPNGNATLQELKYNKMLKTYTGNLSLLESGDYKLSLLLESQGITMP